MSTIITEAEARVIGAVLAENDLFESVVDLGLRESDFSTDETRLTWSALTALRRASQPLNHRTLIHQLRGERDKVSEDYLRNLDCLAASEQDTLADTAIVLRDAQRRALVKFGTNLILKADTPPEHWQSTAEYLDGIIEEAESDLAQISLRSERKPERSFAEIARELLERIGRREPGGLPVGLKSLDEYFGGFRAGHLSVIAARTSRGKTALATQIALETVRADHPVLFVTAEMAQEEMVQRFLSCQSQVNLLRAAREGFYDDDDETKAWTAADLIGGRPELSKPGLPLLIRYRPLLKPRELRVEIRRAAQEFGRPLGLVIVDYLGLMRGDRHEQQRFIEIGNIVVQIKAMAGELGIPILLAAQINREGGRDRKDEDYPPQLRELRDSGTLEEHCDDCFMLWHKPKSQQKARPGWIDVQVIIAKQRNGPRGAQCDLLFQPSWGLFRDSDSDIDW
jgi:replicative DNA helicase